VKNSIGKFANYRFTVLSQWVHDFCDHSWSTKDFIKSVTCGVAGKSTSSEVFYQVPDMFSRRILVSHMALLVVLWKGLPAFFCRPEPPPPLPFQEPEDFLRLTPTKSTLISLPRSKSEKQKNLLFCHRSIWNQKQCSSLDSRRKHHCGRWNHVGSLLSGEIPSKS
jgi:hypothetical protein